MAVMSRLALSACSRALSVGTILSASMCGERRIVKRSLGFHGQAWKTLCRQEASYCHNA